jgi:hypothetical protein
MNPTLVTAQFAAFTWYSRSHPSGSPEDARRFARTNWGAFLGVAPSGLGRLLLKIRPDAARRGIDSRIAEKRSAAAPEDRKIPMPCR